MGADRTVQVEEFLQRKREAMLNKVRAEGQLVCNVTCSGILRVTYLSIYVVTEMPNLFHHSDYDPSLLGVVLYGQSLNLTLTYLFQILRMLELH